MKHNPYFVLFLILFLAIAFMTLACDTTGICDESAGNNCAVNSGETFGKNAWEWADLFCGENNQNCDGK